MLNCITLDRFQWSDPIGWDRCGIVGYAPMRKSIIMPTQSTVSLYSARSRAVAPLPRAAFCCVVCCGLELGPDPGPGLGATLSDSDNDKGRSRSFCKHEPFSAPAPFTLTSCVAEPAPVSRDDDGVHLSHAPSDARRFARSTCVRQ